MKNIPTYSSKLIKKHQLTKDMVSLSFEKPKEFNYLAGQFVQWHVPTKDSMVLRSYSISSPPKSDYLEFCVKLLPDGKAAQYIEKLKINDKLTFQGPQGRFTIVEKNKPIFFIATGAGIAPIISIIEDELLFNENNIKIHLLFGLRFEEDLFWQERIETIQQTYENFSYQITLSRPKDTWYGLKGRVTDHINIHPVEHQYFLCGSIDMVKDARKLLIEQKVSPKEIHFEIF